MVRLPSFDQHHFESRGHLFSTFVLLFSAVFIESSHAFQKDFRDPISLLMSSALLSSDNLNNIFAYAQCLLFLTLLNFSILLYSTINIWWRSSFYRHSKQVTKVDEVKENFEQTLRIAEMSTSFLYRMDHDPDRVEVAVVDVVDPPEPPPVVVQWV